MTVDEIRALGPDLADYLDEFAECFPRRASRFHLQEYVRGQLSHLPRKSVEPMAHLRDVPPRTLQEFLSLARWDHDRLRDTVQRIVARDHAEPQGIGIIDESGHPKKGTQTAGVQRQYCGATGKIDNCVMTVHLGYASFAGEFRAMLDSDLYLPKQGWDDPARRQEAAIPESVRYRPKHLMALDQVRRALGNGLSFGWIVADEWYGAKAAFLAGLEDLGLRFVLEIPRNTRGWLAPPKQATARRSQVQHLLRWATPMLYQDWVDYHVKDTGMGALVWQVKAAPFWRKRGKAVVGPDWLVVARDRLHPEITKYFLSNAGAGMPLEVLLHVAFRRWPVERTLEDEKSELGLSHFEVRKYPAIVRHLRITQVSHLFLARQTQRRRGEKPGGDALSAARCRQRPAGRAAPAARGPGTPPGQGGADPPDHPSAQRQGARRPCEGPRASVAGLGHSSESAPLLHPHAQRVAL